MRNRLATSNICFLARALLGLLAFKVSTSDSFVLPSGNGNDNTKTTTAELGAVSSSSWQTSKEIELLEGKLSILEDVVTELHHRNEELNKKIAADNDSNKAKNDTFVQLQQKIESFKEREREQNKELELLEKKIKADREAYDKKVNVIEKETRELVNDNEIKVSDYLQQISFLQKDHDTKVQRLQESLKEKDDLLREKCEENLEMKLRIEHLENIEREMTLKRAKDIAELDQCKSQLLQTEEEMARVQLTVQDYQHQIRVLESKIEMLSMACRDTEDRIEIATAAVKVSEKREMAATEKFKQAERRLKQLQLFLKVQQLSQQALEVELETTNEDTQKIQLELSALKAQINQPKGVWGIIKTLWSKKR